MDLQRTYLPLLLLITPVLACNENVQTIDIDKTHTRSVRKGEFAGEVSPAQRFGSHRPLPGATGPGATGPGANGGNPGASARKSFHYRLPEGWKELPPKSLRNLNFLVAGHSDAQCYLTVMSARGSVIMNVNRWRGQVGLPDVSEAEIAALPKKKWFGQMATYVELRGNRDADPAAEKKDILAVYILVLGSELLTLKMFGPAAVLEPELAKFQELAAEMTFVKPAGAGVASNGGADGGTHGGKGKYHWIRPASWKLGSDKRMRMVTFTFGKSGKSECYVSVAGGTLEGNVNRWRGQFGLAKLDSDEIAALAKLEVMGKMASIVEHRGRFAGIADAGMLGLVCKLEARSLFVKMTGPADEVFAERENFLSFCRSLHQD